MRIGCSHFSRCSGCVYDSCEKPPEIFERAHTFFQQHYKIPLKFKRGAVRGWRTRAKLAVRAKAHIGLFEKGSHKVLDIPHCQVHHPRINQAVARFLKAFEASSLTAYDETSHTGDLRYLQVVIERRTGKAQLTCVLNRPLDACAAWMQFCKELFINDWDNFWHSIWINSQSAKSNTIFGHSWQKVIGQDYVWEQILDKEFAFGPEHFGQANLEMYELLVQDIGKRLHENPIVAELYAGIGVIGLSVVEKTKEMRLCEVQSHALPCFEIAKERLHFREQKKLSYLVAPAEKSLDLVDGVDTCIVDPPRKGLGKESLDTILSKPTLKQLVYVSCEWKSLQRDCLHILKQHPDWKVEEAISYLFFPGTNQIETVAFLKKSEID